MAMHCKTEINGNAEEYQCQSLHSLYLMLEVKLFLYNCSFHALILLFRIGATRSDHELKLF